MNTHKLHAPIWIGVLVVVALIVAHAALIDLVFRDHLSVALVAGMLGLVALKFMWWKLRR